MNPEWLRQRISELQDHIIDFRIAQTNSENSYRRTIEMITNPMLGSLLMEHYVINTERQNKSIAKLERLCKEAQAKLLHLEKAKM